MSTKDVYNGCRRLFRTKRTLQEEEIFAGCEIAEKRTVRAGSSKNFDADSKRKANGWKTGNDAVSIVNRNAVSARFFDGTLFF